MMKYNLWLEVIKYINKKTESFTPENIRNHTYDTTTINGYLNFLCKYGFIERISRGVFIRKIDIPEDLTIEDIKNIIYGDGSDEKILLHKRKIKIDNLNIK